MPGELAPGDRDGALVDVGSHHLVAPVGQGRREHTDRAARARTPAGSAGGSARPASRPACAARTTGCGSPRDPRHRRTCRRSTSAGSVTTGPSRRARPRGRGGSARAPGRAARRRRRGAGPIAATWVRKHATAAALRATASASRSTRRACDHGTRGSSGSAQCQAQTGYSSTAVATRRAARPQASWSGWPSLDHGARSYVGLGAPRSPSRSVSWSSAAASRPSRSPR